jgi:cell division protein FtsZ
VLVNITASRSLKLSETREVMAAIRGYAAEDATIIFGTVYDESLADAIRVTVVATGLNGGKKSQQRPEEVFWREQATGTYNATPAMTDLRAFQPTSPIATQALNSVTSGYASSMPTLGQATPEKGSIETASGIPAVLKPSPNRGPTPSLGASSSPQARSLLEKGTDFYDIPAFLRKQAD